MVRVGGEVYYIVFGFDGVSCSFESLCKYEYSVCEEYLFYIVDDGVFLLFYGYFFLVDEYYVCNENYGEGFL